MVLAKSTSVLKAPIQAIAFPTVKRDKGKSVDEKEVDESIVFIAYPNLV